MADSALGELRRPSRPIEQRIERIARWRAQGLDSGESDTPFPGDVTDAVSFAGADSGSGSSAGTAAPKWEYDTFSLTSATTNSFALTATPIEKSEVVRVNGLVFTRAEYDITGSTLTFTDLAAVRLGIGSDTWTIALNYAYYDLATGGAAATGASLAYVVADGYGVDLPEAVQPGDVAIAFCSDAGGDVSGAFATWTKIRDDTGGGIDMWIGTGVGTGTAVTIGSGFSDYGAIAVFRGVDLTLRAQQITLASTAATGPLTGTGVGAVVGDIVLSCAIVADGGGDNYTLDGTWSESGFASPLADFGGDAFGNIGIIAGVADATTVAGTFDATAQPSMLGSSSVLNVAFSTTAGDPVIAVPGGTYTPPTPPSTPGTHVLRYQRPDTTGYTSLDVVAGGTFNLDNTVDYAITASGPITSDYVRLVGGRNLDIYGVIFDFSASVPTGSYDADRRGLQIKDGPNPNIKRVIYFEGVWLRSGYYSDGIQIALRHENDVTLIVQALRSDAYGWGQRSGVHSDLIQFYGGPLNFFGDCITGKYQSYQGIFMRPADSRSLPSGADKTDWQLSRVNLESGTGPGGGGAHYLLWDDQPSWTNLTLDEVYITGASGYDVTDGNGNMPSSGLHQNATPSGGDWAPSSWWSGDTYTSPGYV